MKRACPHCGNEVPDTADFCPSCGRALAQPKGEKWYFKTSTLVIAFLCVGPFMLPLLWFHPRFTLKTKVIISAVIIIASYYTGVLFYKSVKAIMNYYQIMLQP